MVGIEILPSAPWMPNGLRDLDTEAQSHGIGNMATLIARWANGSERYERPGESLLVAIDPSPVSVVGIGGIARCPDVSGALRVRRFYVAARWRRQGVARTMAERLIENGLRHSRTLTCNARASPAAPPFWEAMGFSPVAADGITHILVAEDTAPTPARQ